MLYIYIYTTGRGDEIMRCIPLLFDVYFNKLLLYISKSHRDKHTSSIKHMLDRYLYSFAINSFTLT